MSSDSAPRTGPSPQRPAVSPTSEGARENGLAAPAQMGEITALLAAVRRGEDGAQGPLFDRIYEELRALAHARLRGERRDVTLGTTGLVHEAYLKLAPLDAIEWQDRGHFFATAARAMRRVLVEHARFARRLKRGRGVRPLTLHGDAAPAGAGGGDADAIIALDRALERLGALSRRQLSVVELRFFAGLSVPETAEVLGISVNTAKRDWSTARIWLNRELG